MTGRDSAAGRSALRELWYEWTSVVEQFARRRGGRRWRRGGAYRALHQDLLRVCNSLAGADDRKARVFYGKLEYLARPWLTPWVLDQADREVLFDLLEHCQRAGREMGGPPWRRVARGWVRRGLVLAAFAVGFALLAWGGEPMWAPLLERAKDTARSVRWAIKQQAVPDWWWLGFGGLATLVTIWVVVRAARS
jgi:hypothetical protein